MKGGKLLLVLAGGVLVIQAIHYWPQLPDVMASHFGVDGEADGWSSKQSFFGIMLAVAALTIALFGLLPALVRSLPASMVNVPNRDYWLAPERRQDLLERIERGMIPFGVATLLFLAAVTQLVIRANLAPQGAASLDGLWPVLILYLALTPVWLIWFVRLFKTPG